MTTTKDQLNHCTMVNTCVVRGSGSRSDGDHIFPSSPSEEVATPDWMKNAPLKLV